MKIIIPGGSGQVGSLLARAFGRDGHDVVVLSRGEVPAPAGRTVRWDGRTLGDWTRELDGADVVINLAGRSVNCRYNAKNRRLIMDSRVDSTRAIGQAIGACSACPKVWLQASTATIYAHRFDGENDEASGIIGGNEPGAPSTWRFSTEVARAWEEALNAANTPATRKVAMRSAMVMSPDAGGIFDTLLTLVRRGLGGTSGDGRQYVSWIHEQDFVAAVRFLMDHSEISGPVNISAPHPRPNAEFMRELRHAWGASVGLPATKWMLEVGAVLMRTETELVLKSRRVVPGRLLLDGFGFLFPKWPEAAADLCNQTKAMNVSNAR